MKHKGCYQQFTDQRNKELMAAYRKAVELLPYVDITLASTITVNSTCSRFWVSEERANIVVSAIERKQDILSTMRPLRKEMFIEIYRRYLELRKDYPNETMYNLVFEVVNSPASKFYMQPRCAMEVIYKIKNGFYETRKRKD